MRRHLLVLTAALSVWLAAPVPAQAQELVLNRLAEYFESLRIQAGIPGLAAAIVGPDNVVWEQAFGRQNAEAAVATRPDTPFHIGGLTQLFTATLVLRCVEEGRLSLDDRIGQFKPSSPDAQATIRQVLTHTSAGSGGLVFSYRPERLEPLARAVRVCTDNSFRETVANTVERLAMIDSVPGPDIIHPELLAEGIPSAAEVERYRKVLGRLATPYAVEPNGRATPSQYADTTLTPGSGLISTVRDFAQFDLALKKGVLLQGDTLEAIRRVPQGPGGDALPHGLGWFVQSYRGEPVIWQLGVVPNASSALAVTLPARGVTLVIMANSDGLAKSLSLTTGDVAASPFARLFLGLVVR